MRTEPSPSSTVFAGVDRSHGRALPQKLAFSGLNALAVAFCIYLVWGSGLTTIGQSFGRSWHVTEPLRAQILVGVTILYGLRLSFTHFYLLQRHLLWSEALGLGLTMLPVGIGLCVLATGITRSTALPLGWVDGLAVGLVLLGSYLNTGSELQRKWWKQDPTNKGKCYTQGLFRYSMHINYFGDMLLFTGWCLLTAVWWTLALPLAMTMAFVFYHIPGLDRYLEERYGDDFRHYAKHTKKLIPFVY